MTNIKTFEDLVVWQKAHNLVLKSYNLTKKYPKDEIYGIISQIRRSASSVPANIVEGFRRRSTKDSLNFYRMADASLEELKYHFILSKDLGYITRFEFDGIFLKCEEVGKILYGWVKSQK